MLSHSHLSQLHDFLNPEMVFPGTNNRGGLCYFLIDSRYDTEREKGTLITTISNQTVVSSVTRPLNTFECGIFMRDSQGVEIVKKVIGKSRFTPLSSDVSAAKAFGFRTFFVKDSRFKKDHDGMKNPVKCYGRSAMVGFVEREEINSHRNWIDIWKIYVPESNNIGTELNDDNQNVLIGEPCSICTETYLVVGAEMNLTENKAKFLERYLKTKFARFLHGQAKVSQHGTKQTYRFVPVPDISENSPINWETSLAELDEQLFDFYGFTEAQKNHVRESIKDMV